jgi:hypothetical protein
VDTNGTEKTTKERIRERRLDRMRLGQAVCDYVDLPSDPEIRVCIVPLTEADYLKVLEKTNDVDARDDLAGMSIRERVQAQEMCVRAIREEHDLTKRVYNNVEEMLEDFEVADVDEIYDRYREMTQKSSPSLEGIPDDEFVEIKKLLLAMDWSALSGRSWYAAKRFLSTITPSPLLDSLPGFTSTNSLTTTNESDESTSTASPSSMKPDAKSATK